MDPWSSGIMFAVMTLVSTWLVSFAYKNVKFQLKHKWVLLTLITSNSISHAHAILIIQVLITLNM